MKLQAFEIEQNRKKFYLTHMTANQLCDEGRVKADIWSPDNVEGYQRELARHRARLFAKYITNPDNISPPAVLLSVREPIQFIQKEDRYGILKIPDSSVLYEVDGQHRIGGLKEALMREELPPDISLPVIVICPTELGEKEAANPRFCEAKQFVVINRTQKTVRADLSDRFISRLTDEQRRELEVLGKVEDLERTQMAVLIVDELNNKKGSLWENKIKVPGQNVGVVSQRTFTNSLEPILKDPILKTYSYDELVDALDQYWSAWKDLCPLAFEDPQHHVIQKTVGLMALHELFREVTRLVKSRGNDWMKGNFYEVLNNMTKGVSDDFWHSRGEGGMTGTSIPALRELASKLRENFLASNWR